MEVIYIPTTNEIKGLYPMQRLVLYLYCANIRILVLPVGKTFYIYTYNALIHIRIHDLIKQDKLHF